ncbi:MAG: glucose-6-phosphate isomerase [Rhodocyclaceae bacterium]|nr:glucose-6-phosphate isomerase [Rhodocyclaceae bacterium]
MAAKNSAAWTQLQQHAKAFGTTHLRDLFAKDAQRFERFSLQHDGILLDFSKQRINAEILAALHALWHAAEVPALAARMRAGELINHTEGRAVMHTALRQSGNAPVNVGGKNLIPDVHRVLQQMEKFCADIHGGAWRGATGEPIRQIVNIGIGGSDLGPKMAARALAAHHNKNIRVDFVSNVDAADLAGVLETCAPANTLFIIASKTFTTQETMQNAASARAWLVAALGEAAVAKHFVAVSTNLKAIAEFGINPENSFEFWDWVGGRFSVWSAIGLALALAIGMENFRQFLAGAETMDQHFFAAPVEHNLPATLALLEVWNTNFLGAQTRALLPYSQSLELLPRFLQQLEMESNGKRIDRDGNPLQYASAPIVWGEAGTNGQHAFYQLIHQGGRLVPCEFITFITPDFDLPEHHAKLLSHCFAQSEALMIGRLDHGVSSAPTGDIPSLAAYKTFLGNQPSTTLLLDRLNPFSLGQLIALYEHKVFTLGALWNVNSFDQFGVELGKQLANRLLPMLEGRTPIEGVDSSTAGLIAASRR